MGGACETGLGPEKLSLQAQDSEKGIKSSYPHAITH